MRSIASILIKNQKRKKSKKNFCSPSLDRPWWFCFSRSILNTTMSNDHDRSSKTRVISVSEVIDLSWDFFSTSSTMSSLSSSSFLFLLFSSGKHRRSPKRIKNLSVGLLIPSWEEFLTLFIINCSCFSPFNDQARDERDTETAQAWLL